MQKEEDSGQERSSRPPESKIAPYTTIHRTYLVSSHQATPKHHSPPALPLPCLQRLHSPLVPSFTLSPTSFAVVSAEFPKLVNPSPTYLAPAPTAAPACVMPAAMYSPAVPIALFVPSCAEAAALLAWSEADLAVSCADWAALVAVSEADCAVLEAVSWAALAVLEALGWRSDMMVYAFWLRDLSLALLVVGE